MSAYSYEEFTREELIKYIELCQDFFDENSIPDNEHGALYSVYGRLIKYAEQKNKESAALRERVEALEEALEPFANAWRDGGSKESNEGAALGECLDRVEVTDFENAYINLAP